MIVRTIKPLIPRTGHDDLIPSAFGRMGCSNPCAVEKVIQRTKTKMAKMSRMSRIEDTKDIETAEPCS